MLQRTLYFLLFIALLSDAALSQSSFGVSFAGEFSDRTLQPELDEDDPTRDELTDRTDFAFRPSVGLTYTRQLNRLFALDVQVRYQTAGYSFNAGNPALDPLLGTPAQEGFLKKQVRYDFISIPVGATESFGSGAWRYYVEEYIVPMFYVATTTKTTFDGEGETSERANLDRVNDFHIGARAGIGVERMLNSILRLRVGIVGRYHFTLTNKDAQFREHLYAFGPQVSVARVFGRAVSPTGKADEIYY